MLSLALYLLTAFVPQSPTDVVKSTKAATPTTVVKKPAAKAVKPRGPEWRRFLIVKVHDPAFLALDARVSAAASGLMTMIESLGENGKKTRQFLEILAKAKPWPVEVQFYMFPDAARRMMIPIFYDGSNLDMAETVKSIDPKSAKRLQSFEWKGERYQMAYMSPKAEAAQSRIDDGRAVNYGCMIFGKIRGRDCVLITSTQEPLGTPEEEASHALTELSKIDPTARPLPESLASRLRGRGVEVVFQMSEIFDSMLTKETQPRYDAMLGGRMDGLVYRLDCQDGRLIGEGFFDIRALQGLFGTLLATSGKASALRGWIPSDATEFFHAAFNLDNLGPAVAAAGAAGFPIHPSQWGGRFLWLRNALGTADPVKVLQSNLTGEIAMASTFDRASGATHVASKGMRGLYLLGAHDGAKILAWANHFVAEEGATLGVALSPFKCTIPGVHALTIDRRPVLYIAARKEWIALADAIPENLTILQSVLATEGRSSLPPRFAERFGGDLTNSPSTVISASHVLTSLDLLTSVQQSMGAASSDKVSAVLRSLRTAFAGPKGTYATHVVCSKEGLTITSIW